MQHTTNRLFGIFIVSIVMLLFAESAHARVFHAGLGRFTTRDPLGYVDGASLYQYVSSNPLAGVDPQGTVAEDTTFLVSPCTFDFVWPLNSEGDPAGICCNYLPHPIKIRPEEGCTPPPGWPPGVPYCDPNGYIDLPPNTCALCDGIGPPEAGCSPGSIFKIVGGCMAKIRPGFTNPEDIHIDICCLGFWNDFRQRHGGGCQAPWW